MAERTVGWKKQSENTLIGTEQSRLEGAEKATGAAEYAADTNTKATLIGKLLTAKVGHAKIKALDTSKAKKVKGVKALLEMRSVGDEIHYDGTPLVAVAAERPEYADDAIRAIEVEFEPLPHFVAENDLKGATDAEVTRPLGENTKGDVEAALAKAKVIHEGYYGIHTISHMCMEPHGSHSEWKGDELDCHLSTQNVSGTAGQFTKALGIDAAKVSITCNYIGGGFGSKFAVDEWDIACAKLAKEAGQPVQLMLDRATELKIAGNRPSGFALVKIAADAEGKVVAWDSSHWGTDGPTGGTVALNQYPYVFDFENRNRKATGIKTNCGPKRAWRAPNHPQLCAMTDTAIDDIAWKLNLDSKDVFIKNLDFVPEERAPVYLEEIKIGAKLIDWDKNWHPHGKENGKGAVKRGLGMAIHTWGGRAGRGTCLVKVYPDGTVESLSGTQDIGTGTRTVIAMTLAETFGVPLDKVKVHIGNNKHPYSGPSGGSTTIGGVTGPNRRAALEALWKIFDLVAEKHKVEADSLSARDEKIFSGNEEVCTWKQACALVGPMALEVQGKGPAKDGLTDSGVAGVQMADVSVDSETGLIRINKLVAVQDCGLIVNPKTAKSQIYGALIMGISYALTEERIMDNKTGRFINADLINYKLPRIGDIGELVAELYEPESEYKRGVIGLGEPPVISTGAAISNAVANALGVRVPVLPLTPKRVLDAMKGGQS